MALSDAPSDVTYYLLYQMRRRTLLFRLSDVPLDVIVILSDAPPDVNVIISNSCFSYVSLYLAISRYISLNIATSRLHLVMFH